MQGAKKLLKRLLPHSLVTLFLPTYHLGRAIYANYKFGRPAKHLKVVAVTGTNGKTTTAHFITKVLEAAGYKVGLSTTARFQIGRETWDNELNMTVTNPFELQSLLKRMQEAKVDWVVLEVTSHALIQHRIWGIPIHTAVITNLTQDHLDYHHTMEEYAAAKARLFKLAKFNAVLNHDDDWFNFFVQRSPQSKFSYGAHPDADIRLTKANLKPHGAKIMLQYGHGGEEVAVELNLTGKFNVYNALAAAGVGHALDLNPQLVKQGLENLRAVPGRMEAVKAGQDFSVIVDYAHSPDAQRNLFETLKPLTDGRLIAVFGATGDRDKTKRPLMGAIASKLCDVVIVTDEDTYSEDPASIRQEILSGARGSGGQAEVLEVGDRHDAMARAFQMAEPGDTVAVLGMGHQKHRVVGETKQDWDDRQVARDILEAAAKKSKQ